MAKIKDKGLENALSKKEKQNEKPSFSKDEEIGFHKGALDTLAKERLELLKMAQNVESLMAMHIKRL